MPCSLGLYYNVYLCFYVCVMTELPHNAFPKAYPCHWCMTLFGNFKTKYTAEFKKKKKTASEISLLAPPDIASELHVFCVSLHLFGQCSSVCGSYVLAFLLSVFPELGALFCQLFISEIPWSLLFTLCSSEVVNHSPTPSPLASRASATPVKWSDHPHSRAQHPLSTCAEHCSQCPP